MSWWGGCIAVNGTIACAYLAMSVDPEPCFASKRAEQKFYDQFWFSRVRDLSYQP
jgi:hypothetical protein